MRSLLSYGRVRKSQRIPMFKVRREVTLKSSWTYGAKYWKLNCRGLPVLPATLKPAGWNELAPEK